MTDHSDEHPSARQPLHGPRRTYVGPALVVIGILLLVLVVFAVITYARYNS